MKTNKLYVGVCSVCRNETFNYSDYIGRYCRCKTLKASPLNSRSVRRTYGILNVANGRHPEGCAPTVAMGGKCVGWEVEYKEFDVAG